MCLAIPARIEELFGEYVKVDDIVGMYRPIYYRNKVHAVFGLDRKNNPISGILQRGDTSDSSGGFLSD